MTLSAFRNEPWKTSHKEYESSLLHMRPAPEFATAEVVLASTYRAVGFATHSEKAVPGAGRDFDRDAGKNRKRSSTSLNPEAWKTILHGGLQSPKQPKQSSRRFLQLCPVVPDAALYSNSARLTGNSWDPGQLVARMIIMGSPNIEEARKVWLELFSALSVGAADDVWARWLQAEFETRRRVDAHWALVPLDGTPVFSEAEIASLRVPASRFVRDLRSVIKAKQFMTRRQWVSIVESILRIGTVAHTLWLCEVNDRYATVLMAVLEDPSSAAIEKVEVSVFGRVGRPLVYGMPAVPTVRELGSRYLSARLKINLVLWHLEERGVQIPSLGSIAGLEDLLRVVRKNRTAIGPVAVRDEYQRTSDERTRELQCRRGIGSNIVEFCRYALGQRQTADDTLRGYDQGFTLRKKADYASAPWVVGLGPVALLAFAHCCLSEATGPRSVGKLTEHLSQYGIDISPDEVSGTQLGNDLRTLGLVLDSPDAESGMLLVPPFGDMGQPPKKNGAPE